MLSLSKKKIEELRSMDPEDAAVELARLNEAEKERKRAHRRANLVKAAALARKWRKKNRRRAKELDKATRERIKADPERRERYKAVRKEWLKKTQARYASSAGTARQREYDRRSHQRKKTRSMARVKPNELKALIRPFVPGYLQPSAKMDVIAAVVELALQNKVEFNKLKDAVKQCVTAHNRQFDHFKNVSIDAPIAGTDGLTRADLLDSETFHF